tara:strand:- start:516 stop:809 length:294 start_codon:yes stop_codon:yes gene_type:complete
LRRAAKVDRNQPEIVKALRKVGAVVLITSQLKNCFDILVLFQSRIYIVELKDGELPPSARKLTGGELEFKQKAESVGCTYHVITSIDEALAMITNKS